MNTKTATKKTALVKPKTKAAATGMETTVYSNTGKASGKATLPAGVFDAGWKADLVHDVVVAMQSNARAGTAHTKDRSEVRGGGKKPWRQKGTGRARHGSRRSPIWTGGGVTFGPRNEKNYTKKINKNMRARALASVLSKKYADGEVMLVDSLALAAPKAADAKSILTALGSVKGYEAIANKKANNALVILAGRDEHIERSFRNFGNVAVMPAKDVSLVELLTYKHLVVVAPEETLATLAQRVATKRNRTETNA